MLEMHTLLYIIYHIDWRGGDPSARGLKYDLRFIRLRLRNSTPSASSIWSSNLTVFCVTIKPA